MCVSIKNINRKAAIKRLLDYTLVLLNDSEEKWVYRKTALNSYAFDSGVSLRTLREYLGVLTSAGFIRQGWERSSPVIRLVKDAE